MPRVESDLYASGEHVHVGVIDVVTMRLVHVGHGCRFKKVSASEGDVANIVEPAMGEARLKPILHTHSEDIRVFKRGNRGCV